MKITCSRVNTISVQYGLNLGDIFKFEYQDWKGNPKNVHNLYKKVFEIQSDSVTNRCSLLLNSARTYQIM